MDKQAGWQLTATTINCDVLDDEATIIVYKDWSVKCTGYVKYSDTSGDALNLLKQKGKQLKRQLQCEGPECWRVVQYKDKLFAEEVGKS